MKRINGIFGGFIFYFLILLLGSAALTTTVLHRSRAGLLEEYMLLSSKQIEVQSRLLRNHFNSIRSDLLFLPQLNEILRFKEAGKEKDRRDIEDEFLEFIKSKQLYDQLRYIGNDGMELTRVNFNNGDAEIIPGDRLQNKGGRYYVSETMKTPKGDIYISPFDLNVEHGKVEIPLKPMLRFGTPVYDKNDQLNGVIILNYLGNRLIKDLREATETYPGTFSLLNTGGFWLYNDNPEQEWGFMFPEKTDSNLAVLQPELWKKISAETSHQDYRDGVLYTSEVIRLFHGRKEEQLIIINSITAKEMGTDLRTFRRKLAAIIIVEAVFFGILAFILTRIIAQRNRYRTELKRSALYDGLTGLPNRTLLAERSEQAITQARRYSYRIALFFIDLDGFKAVNDTFGHDAGDIILKKVSDVLLSNIRSSDTAARFGGDEFIILLSRISKTGDCAKIAKKLITELSKEFDVMGQNVRIGGSIGVIAPGTENTMSFPELLKKADAAMYEVKKTGKNSYIILES